MEIKEVLVIEGKYGKNNKFKTTEDNPSKKSIKAWTDYCNNYLVKYNIKLETYRMTKVKTITILKG